MPKIIDNLNIAEIPQDVQNFFRSNKLQDLPVGRYDFSNGVYLNIDSYSTRPRSKRKYEAHRQYLDVQYIITGEEVICIENIDKLRVVDEYDEVKDCIFYGNEQSGIDYLMKTGEGMIIYPEDGHMPCVQASDGNPVTVKKMVIKLPVEASY